MSARALLETGGGMIKALPLIDADPFFCLNSDNVWLDGRRTRSLRSAHAWDAGEDGCAAAGSVHAARVQLRRARAISTSIRWAGSSWRKPGRRGAVHLHRHPDRFAAPAARGAAGAFSTGVLWDRAIAEGRLYGISHSGLWFEVGAPEMIAPTEAALQRG